MTDKILTEIEDFLKNNEKDTQIYIDVFQQLDLDSQFQLIDAIKYLITEEGFDTQQAVAQVFDSVLHQMRQDNVFRVSRTM